MARYPTKGQQDVSVLDFYTLLKTSRKKHPIIRDIYQGLRSSLEATGTPVWNGIEYAGAILMNGNISVFCLNMESAEKLAAILGLPIGGYPDKGDMLIRNDVWSVLRTSEKNRKFADAWETITEAAREGKAVAEIGGHPIRVAIVASGTRSAAAIHPGDTESLALAIGHEMHKARDWTPDWVGRNEVASAVGTGLGETFLAVWKELVDIVEISSSDDIEYRGIALKAAILKRGGATSAFIHQTSIQAFIEAEFFPDDNLPPKTSEWRGISEFSRDIGLYPNHPGYRRIVDDLVGMAREGNVPELDGKPIRFARLRARIQRPWCFHYSESERMALAVDGLKEASSTDDLPEWTPYADSRYSKAIYAECLHQWKENDGKADIDGHILSGEKTDYGWRLDAVSASTLSALARGRESTLYTPDVMDRIDAYASLDEADPKEFSIAWQEIFDAAATGSATSEGIRPRMHRRVMNATQIAVIPSGDIALLAGRLGCGRKHTLPDPENYIRASEVLRVFGNDQFVRLVIDEIVRVDKKGEDLIRDGDVIRCGYEQARRFPFAVHASALPGIGQWIEAIRDGNELIGGEDVVEVDDMDSLFGM